MAFSEKIKLVIDVVAGQSRQTFAQLRSDIRDTDGAFGKLKVAGAGAFDFMKQNAAGFATAAGAALVGFAAKSVSAFQDLALGAAKFADATGLAVEDASRWIEVAGDMEVESSTVQKALGKMNLELGKNAAQFEELGVQIARTKDGAVDVNGTFLNVIDRLNAIKDPTERAATAQKLLGKGWMEMAELINVGSDELRRSLGAVSDAKVIDEAEVAKARKFRERLDELGDAAQDLSLEVGEDLVPALIAGADMFMDLYAAVTEVAGAIDELIGKGSWIQQAFSHGDPELMNKALEKGAKLLDENSRMYVEYGEALRAAGSGTTLLGAESEFTEADLAEMGAEAERAKRRIDDLRGGVDRLRSALSDRQAMENAVRQWDRYLWAATAAQNAEQAGAAEAADLRAEANEEAKRSIDLTLAYIATVGGVPKQQETKIKALIDQGAYNEVAWMLAELSKTRQAQIQAVGTYLGRMKQASGGWAGGQTLVGEEGPELLDLPPGSYVHSNSAATTQRALGGGVVNQTIINNYPPGVDPRAVARADRRYRLRNGPS